MGHLVVWSVGWLMFDGLVGWWVDCLVGGLVCGWDGCLVGRLVGQRVG